MATMDALLRIKADVQGEGQVASLGRALGGLNKTADGVGRGLSNLAGTISGLVGTAGLGLIAKQSLDAADNMNDLSQKTGVSVEALSQFNQAAEKSGTTIESVAGAMVKLGRGMVDGKANEALKQLGISATDASGKLKSSEQIMLEVAREFAKMPDGANKSALAIKLFGKSGADMVPLLNMGDQAIKSLAVTMSGDFAKGADAFNDKVVELQTKLQQLGVKIMEGGLLDLMNKLADGVIAAANAFMKLPEPVQNAIGLITTLGGTYLLLSPLINAIIRIGILLAGLRLPATLAGWLPALLAPFSGLLAWLTGTLLPGLIAFFSGPVGWTVLAVAAVVAMAIAFREPILEFVKWIGDNLAPIGKFFSDLWASILENGGKFLTNLGELFVKGLTAALDLAYKVFVEPWIKLFDTVLREPISKMLNWLSDTFRAPFEAVANFIRGIFNGLLRNIGNGINAAIGMVNRLIGAYNSLPAPDLPYVPTVSIPQFATGGVVNRPTMAMVGEGGEPEYIIPQSKMLAASARYLAGTRGAGVLSGGSPSGAARLGRSQINITTGPVLQQDGRQWVTMADLVAATQATEDAILDQLRTFGGRRAAGIA